MNRKDVGLPVPIEVSGHEEIPGLCGGDWCRLVQDREATISSAECRAKVVPSLSRKKYHVSDAIVVHVSDWTGHWRTRRRLKSAAPITQEDKYVRSRACDDQILIPISIHIRKQISRAHSAALERRPRSYRWP